MPLELLCIVDKTYLTDQEYVEHQQFDVQNFHIHLGQAHNKYGIKMLDAK